MYSVQDVSGIVLHKVNMSPAYKDLLNVHTLVVMAASLFQVTHEGTASLGVDCAGVRDHMQ